MVLGLESRGESPYYLNRKPMVSSTLTCADHPPSQCIAINQPEQRGGVEKNSKEQMQENGQENRRRQGELYILVGVGGGGRKVFKMPPMGKLLKNGFPGRLLPRHILPREEKMAPLLGGHIPTDWWSWSSASHCSLARCLCKGASCTPACVSSTPRYWGDFSSPPFPLLPFVNQSRPPLAPHLHLKG